MKIEPLTAAELRHFIETMPKMRESLDRQAQSLSVLVWSAVAAVAIQVAAAAWMFL